MINRVLGDLSMQWARGGEDGWMVLSAGSSAVDLAITSESEGRCANARAHAETGPLELLRFHLSVGLAIPLPPLLAQVCRRAES